MMTEEGQSRLYEKMLAGGEPEAEEEWQELANVLGSLSRAMKHVFAELDAMHDVVEVHHKVLEQGGFPVNEEHGTQDDLKKLIEALHQEG